MHSYDLETRAASLVALAIVAYFITRGIQEIASTLDPEVWRWFVVPTFGVVFAALRVFVDNWGWRWRLVRLALRIAVKDLSGTWEGTLSSSVGVEQVDSPSTHHVKVRIQQSWTKVFIRLETMQSASNSRTAAWRGAGDADGEMIYTYENEPIAGAPSTMASHGGTTALRIQDGKLIGDYYSGRGRQQHGRFELRRNIN